MMSYLTMNNYRQNRSETSTTKLTFILNKKTNYIEYKNTKECWSEFFGQTRQLPIAQKLKKLKAVDARPDSMLSRK